MSQIIQFPSKQKRGDFHPWIETRNRIFDLIFTEQFARRYVWSIARTIAYKLGENYTEQHFQEVVMAALDGRPAQFKAEFIAEQSALKAQRKGETNEATKKRFTKTAKAVQPVTDEIVDSWIAQLEKARPDLDPAKARKWVEGVRSRCSKSGVPKFLAMLQDDFRNDDFRRSLLR